MKILLGFFCIGLAFSAGAQNGYWQQHVKYNMKINMNVQTNQYQGSQSIVYTNNSPDTLSRLFFHLYWNAFQPNSMMDQRSRRQGTVVLRKDAQGNDIRDWDGRVQDRILHLDSTEIGYERVSNIRVDGRAQKTILHETILEVVLDKAILPKAKATIDMDWTAQVPLQVRRSGRDNPTTEVRYTMTQWYPKLCEYDKQGWHPTPYIAREFYGVWGDYDVTINIDSKYILGGSGYVANGNEVGAGYETAGVKLPAAKPTKSWHFIAPNVHDFAWAADPEFAHIKKKIANGPEIHVLYNSAPPRVIWDEYMDAEDKAPYQNKYENYTKAWKQQWQDILDAAVTVFPFIKSSYGDYPYPQYSFIHGGDGGMEYPNCTMIVSPSLGTAFHEWMHTWYQGMLGTNESMYCWMDEGFTEWATDNVEEYYRKQVTLKKLAANPAQVRLSDSLAAVAPATHTGIYRGYLSLARSGREEPLTTHADHYNTNFAYGSAAYSKGGVFMEQLGYITGASVIDKILKDYYNQWRFKHPDVYDFINVAEKASGMKLDWYQEYFINTTKTIDYGIDSLYELDGKLNVRLKDIGLMPMPVDVKITFRDGSSEWHYIPLDLMYGAKPAEAGQTNRIVYPEWRWTAPTYVISSAHKLLDVVRVEIDPSQRMADIERKNNLLELKW